MPGTSQLLLSVILSPRLSERSSLASGQPGFSGLQSQSRSFRVLITALSLPHSSTAFSTARLHLLLCPPRLPQSSSSQQLPPLPLLLLQPQELPQPPKQDNRRIIHKQFIYFTICSLYCILFRYPKTVPVYRFFNSFLRIYRKVFSSPSFASIRSICSSVLAVSG